LDNKLNTDEIKNINDADEVPAAADAVTTEAETAGSADDTVATSAARTDNDAEDAVITSTKEEASTSDKTALAGESDMNDEAVPVEPIQEEFIIPDDPFSAISISSELQPIEEHSYDIKATLEGIDTEVDAVHVADDEDVPEDVSNEEPAASGEAVESAKDEIAPLVCSAASEESATAVATSRPYKEERYDPDTPRKVDFIFDFLELFVFTLVAVLIVTTFFVRHSIVEGDSMLNTLHNGDTLIISDLFYEPRQNDIIVIESSDLGKAIVKRVIAVGGDRVMVKPDGIYVNGAKLTEPYVYTDDEDYIYDLHRCGKLRDNPSFRLIPGSHYEFTVPKGEVFVMGDHRNDSTDSRDLGTLPVDAILGKVLWRILPFDSFGAVK